MKVVVDARELAGRPTGVGRYLAELLRRWIGPAASQCHEIVLCAHQLPEAVRDLGFRTIETGDCAGGTRWEQFTFPRFVTRERPDVLFCPAYTSPLRARVPIVLTVHDISFVAHPEWFTFREGLRRRLLTRASARKAAAVITVSDFSAAEIAEAFRVPSSRLHVIRHGVSTRGDAASRTSGSEPLVLYVGSIFNRRHVPDLLAAMRLVLPDVRDARLVVVGENRTEPRQDLAALADQHRVGGAVEFADYVSETRLADLYSRARVFVFVSDYEGFGLTPLEALASGVPPVLADTAVAHETCGRAAVYVRPGNVEELAGAIRSLLTDEEARRRVADAAPGVLARYSWARAAESTLRVLEQVAQR